MSKQYNSYTEDFKKTVVALYESGKKVSEIVREYDLEKKLIYNWIKKYGKVMDLGQVFRHIFLHFFIKIMLFFRSIIFLFHLVLYILNYYVFFCYYTNFL